MLIEVDRKKVFKTRDGPRNNMIKGEFSINTIHDTFSKQKNDLFSNKMSIGTSNTIEG